MFTRWQPFTDMRSELTQLHDEMNRLFDRWGENGARTISRGTYPALNIWEDDNQLYIEAELPGFELDDLEIYVTGENQLSLRGERRQPELEGGTWHRQERSYGSFERLVELPYGVDSEKVSAGLKHGLLTVTLPKHRSARPRQIEVKSS
jgi:HSP20 family protein